MENATKALLIAGAVLLVIMIISVGLMIFNSANGQITSAISSMNQQEKDQFNNKFLSYEGIQSGSSVKTLLSTVISHNRMMQDEGTTEKYVSVSMSTGTAGTLGAKNSTTSLNKANSNYTLIENARQSVPSGAKFVVKCTLNSTTGLINLITITRQTQ